MQHVQSQEHARTNKTPTKQCPLELIKLCTASDIFRKMLDDFSANKTFSVTEIKKIKNEFFVFVLSVSAFSCSSETVTLWYSETIAKVPLQGEQMLTAVDCKISRSRFKI